MKIRTWYFSVLLLVIIFCGCVFLIPSSQEILRFMPEGKKICTPLFFGESCKNYQPPPSAHFSKRNWRFKKCWIPINENEYRFSQSCVSQ